MVSSLVFLSFSFCRIVHTHTLQDKMKEKVEKIKAHGINVFVNRQLIYNWPEQLFADAGIVSIEHADFDGVERLALVTGIDFSL